MDTYRILFVCLGNICRSPMAEYVLRHYADQAGISQHIISASAGTSGWHNGENMHQGTLLKLKQNTIDPSGFRSRQIQQNDIDNYDLIIAMDEHNLTELHRLFGQLPQNKIFKLTDLIPESGYSHVPDPWYSGDFDETFRLISSGCQALLLKLGLISLK